MCRAHRYLSSAVERAASAISVLVLFSVSCSRVIRRLRFSSCGGICSTAAESAAELSSLIIAPRSTASTTSTASTASMDTDLIPHVTMIVIHWHREESTVILYLESRIPYVLTGRVLSIATRIVGRVTGSRTGRFTILKSNRGACDSTADPR